MIRIQRHKSMLLAGNTQRTDLVAPKAERRKHFAHGLLQRTPPNLRVLLEVPSRQSPNHVVGASGRSQQLSAATIQRDGLETLRSAIDAQSDHRTLFMFPSSCRG